MLHAYDAYEREREREREREGPKLVIFLTTCLCQSGQNVSRKGYPPFGAGDRNNNPPGTEIIKTYVFQLNIILCNKILIIIIFIIIMILWILHFYYMYTTDTSVLRTQLLLLFFYFCLFLYVLFLFILCFFYNFLCFLLRTKIADSKIAS